MTDDTFYQSLSNREQYRDAYNRTRDPIRDDRLLWRAQTFRHLVHLVPGQTILELGCGAGDYTQQLLRVSRGENPITAVTFLQGNERPENLPDEVEFLRAAALPGALGDRTFDFIVALNLLDQRTCTDLLRRSHDLLRPGGQILFYDSNPWNPVLNIHRLLGRLCGRPDSRRLLGRQQLYELISEIGFIRVFAVYNDFIYRPLTPRLGRRLRNLSVLLENAPGVRSLAGAVLVHAQKPPRSVPRPRGSLCEHPELSGGVSVVIPCHNEEMNVRPLIDRLRELFGEYLHEIIPVDDNSLDGTRASLERLAAEDARIRPVFRTPPNGVGRALADGYRAATGRWVLSMDCDFQHLLPEIRDLFDAAAAGYDVVLGSRFSLHSVLLNYPFTKILANRGFHLLARLLLRRDFRDLTNNLKLFRREVVHNLRLTQTGFAANAETGLQPLLMGCRMVEIPISWINRTPDMGRSSFRLLKVGGGYGKILWRLWLQHLFGLGSYPFLAPMGTYRHTARLDEPPTRIPALPAGKDSSRNVLIPHALRKLGERSGHSPPEVPGHGA